MHRLNQKRKDQDFYSENYAGPETGSFRGCGAKLTADQQNRVRSSFSGMSLSIPASIMPRSHCVLFRNCFLAGTSPSEIQVFASPGALTSAVAAPRRSPNYFEAFAEWEKRQTCTRHLNSAFAR
jgi:hypothetical protein